MRIPTRTDGQITVDAGRTSDQVRQLGAPRRGYRTNPGLGELLRTKHAIASDPLQFDIVTGPKDEEAFVVTGELLVHGKNRASADTELQKRKFVSRGPADHCKVLHDLVGVYSFQDGDKDKARDAVDDALAYLASNNMAAARHSVLAEQMVHKSEDGPAPTSVTVYSFPAGGAALPSGVPIEIAVIDTGIDERLRGDGWLNEVGRDKNGDNLDKLDVFAPTGVAMPVLDFGAGHGTFAAGIIRQVDPLAKIVVYRALNTNGLGSEWDVACAMIRAAEAGAHVISLSVGTEAVDGVVPPALQAAVGYIRTHFGTAIVAAAGNNGNDVEVYPAALPGVIGVAALEAVPDSRLSQPGPPPPAGAEWSTRGPWVRCSTVGEGIVSTFVTGEEDPQVGYDVYPQDAWAVWSGTSFAAPQIAAYIAKKYRDGLQSAQPPQSPQAVADALFPAAGGPADGWGTRVVLLPGTKPRP